MSTLNTNPPNRMMTSHPLMSPGGGSQNQSPLPGVGGSIPSMPNLSGPGTGVSPGGEANGSLSPPGGSGLSDTGIAGGGMSPPMFQGGAPGRPQAGGGSPQPTPPMPGGSQDVSGDYTTMGGGGGMAMTGGNMMFSPGFTETGGGTQNPFARSQEGPSPAQPALNNATPFQGGMFQPPGGSQPPAAGGGGHGGFGHPQGGGGAAGGGTGAQGGDMGLGMFGGGMPAVGSQPPSGGFAGPLGEMIGGFNPFGGAFAGGGPIGQSGIFGGGGPIGQALGNLPGAVGGFGGAAVNPSQPSAPEGMVIGPYSDAQTGEAVFPGGSQDVSGDYTTMGGGTLGGNNQVLANVTGQGPVAPNVGIGEITAIGSDVVGPPNEWEGQVQSQPFSGPPGGDLATDINSGAAGMSDPVAEMYASGNYDPYSSGPFDGSIPPSLPPGNPTDTPNQPPIPPPAAPGGPAGGGGTTGGTGGTTGGDGSLAPGGGGTAPPTGGGTAPPPTGGGVAPPPAGGGGTTGGGGGGDLLGGLIGAILGGGSTGGEDAGTVGSGVGSAIGGSADTATGGGGLSPGGPGGMDAALGGGGTGGTGTGDGQSITDVLDPDGNPIGGGDSMMPLPPGDDFVGPPPPPGDDFVGPPPPPSDDFVGPPAGPLPPLDPGAGENLGPVGGGQGGTGTGGDATGGSATGGSAEGGSVGDITVEAPQAVGQQTVSGSQNQQSSESFGEGQSQSSSTSEQHSESQSSSESGSQSQSSSEFNPVQTIGLGEAAGLVDPLGGFSLPDNPFSQTRADWMVNQANARAAAAANNRMDQLRNTLGGRGFDTQSGAGAQLMGDILRDRTAQEIGNDVRINTDFAARRGAFDQGNLGLELQGRGQDLQRQGIISGIINSLLGQTTGGSESMGTSFGESQSTSFMDALANSQSFSDWLNQSQSQGTGQMQYVSYPIFGQA